VGGWVTGQKKTRVRIIFFDQGAGKKKAGDPVVGGWAGVRKKDGVKLVFRYIFLIAFLNSPHNSQRNAQKRDKKIGFGFLVEFFVKTVQHDVFCKTFFCVFLNSHR
jgi:hypothetical protein